MRTTTAWQGTGNSTELKRATIERRELRDDDLAVRVDYCGVCHSDLHALHGLVGKPAAGMVPGHEFTGTVTEVGSAVTDFAVGDKVAVGTIIDSCGECDMCRAGQENYCAVSRVLTYGGPDPRDETARDGNVTKGGYSREYIVRSTFAYPLPEGIDAAAAAPLMCAGITVWEPLRAAGVGPGSKVAVVGLGGVGHMGVKLAAALGADVTVLSRTADKADDARALGASGLLLTNDDAQLAEASGRFDVILDTVSAPHDLAPLLQLLALDGTLYVLGVPLPTEVPLMLLTMGRRKLSSSGTGGRRGTAEMLAFAGEHGIAADVEVLPSTRVNDALDRLERGDVRYRFVLDMADLDAPAA
ncbi:NAD(P)-dependent alcohol dehydrogenase [Gryllotalpicola reticulitermitis]|uniref:alcohol dehydrogenase (NADP(+)) n=1 Tax=Gryllotalpicola reticulitermitis TaxID=1184153 RepID=A0ABV8Q283_9MICO